MDQTSVFTPLLDRWARRFQLTEADRDAVHALPYTHRTCQRDAYLVREGETTLYGSLLLSGHVYRQKLVSRGARQIVSIHLPTEFVDLQNALLGFADHNVQCLNRAEIAMVSRAALVDLMTAHPRIARAAWRDTLLDASILREWVVNVGRRNASARIAHLLCELITRQRDYGFGSADGCEFPMTQEQIADATGLTPVHTNRTLQMLRRSGLISLSANKLTVIDWARLVELGDFSDRYLHLGE